MTPDEFRHAADRGMGRAALCLLENDPAPYLSELIETCLGGWPDQFERPSYLWMLIAFGRAETRVENALLERLPALKHSQWIEQVWDLLSRFAALGFPRSREAVMAYARRTDHGAKLVAAWGVDGLRWLLEVRPEIFEGDGKGLAMELIDAAEEVSGVAAVDWILSAEVRAAREAYLSGSGHRETPDVDGLDWEGFLARLRQTDRQDGWRLIDAYAKVATSDDLVRIAEWALTEEAQALSAPVSSLFTRRPWPLDPALIFPLLNEKNSNGWGWVLLKLNDSRIRDYVFERLEQSPPAWQFASMMASSITEADLDRLMRILERVPNVDDWEVHELFIGLAEIAERAKPGLRPAFEWGMEHSWCAFCRRDIAQRLARKGLLPEGFRREAGYDAEPALHLYADDRSNPVLSASRFRRAAAKGQGRAVLSAMKGPASLYTAEVRWIALFGAPMLDEEIAPRVTYLWRLIELVGSQESVLDALLLALQTDAKDEYTRGWHQAIVAEYARRGNVRAQGISLPEEADSEPKPKRKGMAAATADELRQRFEAEPDSDLRGREAWAFGRAASEPELRRWAERMLGEEEPDTLDAMGKAFIRRSWPLAPEWVIERVADPDRDQCLWRRMLKAMPNPEVRAFALAKLAEQEPDSDAVGYLRRSFQPGDEAAIYAALNRVRVHDDFETKSFAWEVTQLAQLHGARLFLPHLEWVVEHSSASLYRRSAIELLLNVDALSDYHRQEAAYDAEPETRALVGS